jgi:hypothetical protein
MKRHRTVSIEELRSDYRRGSKIEEDRNEVWTFYLARPVSFYCAAAFLRLGATANQVTWLSFVVLVFGCLLLGLGGHGAALLGAGLLNVWLVLDCVDGTIARFHNSQSLYGAFLDAMSGYAAYALLFLAIGVGAYNRPDAVWLFGGDGNSALVDGGVWMFLGGWTSIATLWSRLAYQKFKNTFSAVELKRHHLINAPQGRSWIRRLLGMGNDLLNVSGVLLPLLFLATLLGALDAFLLLASLGNTALLIVALSLLLRRAAPHSRPAADANHPAVNVGPSPLRPQD